MDSLFTWPSSWFSCPRQSLPCSLVNLLGRTRPSPTYDRIGRQSMLVISAVTSLKSKVAKLLTNPIVASRAIVLFLVATATMFGNSTGVLPPIPDVNLPILYGLARWDSSYYLGIATGGYAVFQHGLSFRPLFPLIMRILYPLFPFVDVKSAEVLAGFSWNLVALGGAAVYLERSTRQ